MTVAESVVRDAHAGLVRLLARTDASPGLVLGAAYEGRRVADILTHLHGWHLLFLGWVAQARASEESGSGAWPAYPAPGHSWDTLELLNSQIYQAYHHLDYAQARERLVESHSRVVEAIRTLPAAQVEDPERSPWLGGASLGEVAHECLAGHYLWAEGILDAAPPPPTWGDSPEDW